MSREIRTFVTIILVFLSLTSPAQNPAGASDPSHSLSLRIQSSQFKDEFNYGLVFRGLNLVVRYSYQKISENKSFRYVPELGFGIDYNKGGGTGVALMIKPVDLFYGYAIQDNDKIQIRIGGYLSTVYNWELYPELQSGHMFWFSSLEAGPQIIMHLPLAGRKIIVTFRNSVAGFTSRPEMSTEEYFYSLRFSDFISNALSNLKFGSYNLFNHTNFEIGLVPVKDKRLSLAYEFEYFGYYEEPRLNYIANSLNLKWKIGRR